MSTDLDPEDSRIEMLARASRRIAVTSLDTAHVVEVARVRRRRRRTIVGSAFAVGVFIVAMSAAMVGLDPGPKTTISAADSARSRAPHPFPAPAEGMKWVGQNGVVVAVPDEWPVSDSPCGTSASAEVVNGAEAGITDCVFQGGQVVLVTINPLGRGFKPRTDFMCHASPSPTCVGGELYRDQGVSFQVSASGADPQGQVDRILDSAMVLPEGWTTVPFTASYLNVEERREALEEAGFSVVATGVANERSRHVTVTPEPGSVVRDGATITLTPVESPDSQPNGDAQVVLLVSSPTSGSRTARISGRVALIGNCAGIGDLVVIWPHDTSIVSEHPLSLDVPGLGVVTEGDVVTGAGGVFDTATDDVTARIPASCGTSKGTTFNP